MKGIVAILLGVFLLAGMFYLLGDDGKEVPEAPMRRGNSNSEGPTRRHKRKRHKTDNTATGEKSQAHNSA